MDRVQGRHTRGHGQWVVVLHEGDIKFTIEIWRLVRFGWDWHKVYKVGQLAVGESGGRPLVTNRVTNPRYDGPYCP